MPFSKFYCTGAVAGAERNTSEKTAGPHALRALFAKASLHRVVFEAILSQGIKKAGETRRTVETASCGFLYYL